MVLDSALPEPDLPRRFEKRVRPEDVRADEGVGRHDRAIDVGFSREVHDRIEPLLTEQPDDEIAVADVAADEFELGATSDRFEIGKVARVRQRIEDNDPIPRALVQPVVYEVRADEPGAARDEQPTHRESPGAPCAMLLASEPTESRGVRVMSCPGR